MKHPLSGFAQPALDVYIWKIYLQDINEEPAMASRNRTKHAVLGFLKP